MGGSILLLGLFLWTEGRQQEGESLIPPAAVEVLRGPARWLLLPRVDERGRRPFRPDQVLARLVEEGSYSPQEGDTLSGERGEFAWRLQEADGNGGASGDIAWAYGEVESASARVVLAHLSGASTLLVNGVPFAGDLYGLGHGRVPVALEAGTNRLFVSGVRGGFALAFETPSGPIVIGGWDCTLPDLVVGRAPSALDAGILVVNATNERVDEIIVSSGGNDSFAEAWSRPFALEPLALLQVPVPIVVRRDTLAATGTLALPVRVARRPGGAPLAEQEFQLAVRDPGALQRRTFRSRVDGSVQSFALLPPAGERPVDAPMRLLLSLHGAGVDASGQAGSYAALPDFWIAAPTNRRPYGFDWQDWGRLDAYEVLERVLAISGVERRFVCLSGHSMGGHGTWHLGANDPDGFAAIAPSAGWRSFDTYGGRPAGALADLWKSADAASDTESLAANLAELPIFVLHGEADDNVPASEGHAMVELLRARDARVQEHFEPNAGHWWDGPAPGTDCLTWPAILELFRGSAIPKDPLEIEFTTVDPGVDATHHWIRVLELDEYGVPARIHARWDPDERCVRFDSENVRAFEISGWPAHSARTCSTASAQDESGGEQILWLQQGGSGTATVLLEKRGDGGGAAWSLEDRHMRRLATPGHKDPERCGPLKRGFDRGFVLVIPTAGSAEEDQRSFERARHDAEVWQVRGNGRGEIVRDVEVLGDAGRFRGRNLVLYGNGDTNRQYSRSLTPHEPIAIERGNARLGEHVYAGNALGALFVRPRADDASGLVVVLGSSGPAADQIAASLALFVSGVGYPDYVLFGPAVLAESDGGVLEAGWFDGSWKLQASGAFRAR